MVLIDTKLIKMLVYRLQNTAFGSASTQAAHLPITLLISAPYPGQICDGSNAANPFMQIDHTRHCTYLKTSI